MDANVITATRVAKFDVTIFAVWPRGTIYRLSFRRSKIFTSVGKKIVLGYLHTTGSVGTKIIFPVALLEVDINGSATGNKWTSLGIFVNC